MKIYQKTYDNEKIKRIFFGGIFKTVTIGNYKIFYFCGIKIYKKLNIMREFIDIRRELKNGHYLFEKISAVLAVQKLHSAVFPQFKEINKGKDVVIIAAGPTLKQYEPIKDAVHIGVNRTFLYDKIKLDYLFMVDYFGVKDYIEQAKNYPCTKFYGMYAHSSIPRSMNIPKHIADEANAYRFYSDNVDVNSKLPIKYDIETSPLMDFNTIVFCALHFAFYTHPQRIFLVGCDCSLNGYFDDSKQDDNTYSGFEVLHNIHLDGYEQVKEFKNTYYHDVEIISINPVGLTGMFKDVYTAETSDVYPDNTSDVTLQEEAVL